MKSCCEVAKIVYLFLLRLSFWSWNKFILLIYVMLLILIPWLVDLSSVVTYQSLFGSSHAMKHLTLGPFRSFETNFVKFVLKKKTLCHAINLCSMICGSFAMGQGLWYIMTSLCNDKFSLRWICTQPDHVNISNYLSGQHLLKHSPMVLGPSLVAWKYLHYQ